MKNLLTTWQVIGGMQLFLEPGQGSKEESSTNLMILFLPRAAKAVVELCVSVSCGRGLHTMVIMGRMSRNQCCSNPQ